MGQLMEIHSQNRVLEFSWLVITSCLCIYVLTIKMKLWGGRCSHTERKGAWK